MRNDDALLRLHASDNVVISKGDMQAGTEIPENGTLLNVTDAIPFGHKVATAAVAKNEAVRKYGQIIGFATRDIAPGEHVHEHNLVFAEFARDYEFGADATPADFIPEAERATFQGIVRADGRVATRNYLAVITSVNCSATVARYICDHFRGPALDAWPNVDGVIALSHGSGCGTASHGDGWDYLRRCIAGYSEHPNIAGTLLLGLGCEINQIDSLVEDLGLTPGETLHTKTIQDMGGTNASVRRRSRRIRQSSHNSATGMAR